MSIASPITAVPVPALAEADQAYAASPARPDGTFGHPWGPIEPIGPADIFRWKVRQTNPFAAIKRDRTPWLPRVRDGTEAWSAVPAGLRVQWLGHASILVELSGTHLLVDPVFGAAGPGVFRAVEAPRLPDDLPPIDAVLVSHGHYDHLDRGSIAAVCRRWPEAVVVVPRGQRKSLPWAARRVVELSWLESVTLGGVECVLTPAQHWHLRRPWDRNRALWGGWMLRGPARDDGSRPSVFHSGDTGWFDGFRVIRQLLGAPDVAVLPLGAYEPRWFMGRQHMPPEDSVQAFVDLQAQHFLGMHWGTFDLSDEPIDQGARDILPRQVAERGLDPDRLHTLAHGGTLSVRPDGSLAGVSGREHRPPS